MRIAVAGSGRLALGLMQALLKSKHQMIALVQNGRTLRGGRRFLMLGLTRLFPLASHTVGFAMRHHIPIIYIDAMNEAELAPLRALDPDLLLVSGFSIILKKPILDLPRIGCVNVHSALLPKHRGPNPFSAVILDGDKESGVTFHVIDEGIDTGDIIEQYAFVIGPKDNPVSVYMKSAGSAQMHVVEVMARIERSGLKGTPQDNDIATYDPKLKPEDVWLDWRKSAVELKRLVRASRPFVLPWFDWRRGRVFVTMIAAEDMPVDAKPGTVMQNRPYVRIATGRGIVTIASAYTMQPFPWRWPNRWNRPERGETLE